MDELPEWKDEKPKHWTETLGAQAFAEYLETETKAQRKEREEWHLRKPEDHIAFLKRHLKGPKLNGPNGQDTSRRSREFKGFISLAEFLDRMRPPDYLADGLLLKGSTYTLTGNTGHCKTLICILLAIKVAIGDWFCGKACKRGKVVFFAARTPTMSGFSFMRCAGSWVLSTASSTLSSMRASSTSRRCGEGSGSGGAVYQSGAGGHRQPAGFLLGRRGQRQHGDARSRGRLPQLTEQHPNRPTTLITAHPTKNAQRDQLLPRGGSALTNELDGNLTAWITGNVVTLHWLGKLGAFPSIRSSWSRWW